MNEINKGVSTVTNYARCSVCGKDPAQPKHPCPLNEAQQSGNLCDCCEGCAQICADEVARSQ